MPLPSIGRIVHYRVLDNRKNGDADIAPAIITAVHGPSLVSLSVFHNAAGIATFAPNVPEGTDAGTWQWPPYVPDRVVTQGTPRAAEHSPPLVPDAVLEHAKKTPDVA